MARLDTCIVGAAIALVTTVPVMGCALVGYNFDDYQPGSGGAGGDSSVGPGSSSSTLASSTASGATAGSSTGTGSSGENCVNGTDDDSDGQVDCADTDCPGFTCTPAAPPGWSGPITFWQGAPSALPGCGGGTLLEQGGAGSLNAPPAACQCSCSAPQGVSCSDMDITFFLDDSCATTPTSVLTATNLVCSGVPPAILSVSGKTPTVTGLGGCLPSLTPLIATASFSESAIVCGSGATAGGCTGTDVCAPAPAPPFSPNLCIYQTGDVACSDPAYPSKNLMHKTIMDSRACGPCSCSAPSVFCTGGTVVYSDPNCGNPVNNVLGPGCYGFGSIASMMYTSNFTGACISSLPDPIGSALPAEPITVCCPPP